MKKPVLLLLGIAIGIGVSYFYFNNQEATTASEKVMKSIVKPKGVITPAQAKTLNNKWTDTREHAMDSIISRISQGRIKKDNRSSWWSLEDIENYLAYAENQADNLGYTLNGIRIYQGVYEGNAPNGKADYATLFWVPTGKKSKSEGSMLNFTLQGGDKDIPGGDPLNQGGTGNPPGSGY